MSKKYVIIKEMIKEKIKRIVFSALFLAVGMVLPFITGQIRDIGNMLLPMHLPVFLCGFILGAPYGFVVGIVLPMFRSIIFGMPVLLKAIGMSFELATYGFVSGYFYNKSKHKCIIALYKSLIISMIFGRIVWGFVSIFLYGVIGSKFTFSIFMAYAFINAIPGIILQLISIPMIMLMFDKTHLVKFNKKQGILKAMTMLFCVFLMGCSIEFEKPIEIDEVFETTKSTELIDETKILETEESLKIEEGTKKTDENHKVIYLTFDDGPGEYTDQFLELFDKYNAKVTYFCTNNSVEIRERIKKIYEKGHTLGVHSYSHNAKKIYQSEEAYFEDLIAEENVLKEAVGINTRYVRLPYGSSNKLANYNPGVITRITQMLTDAGFEYFDWNISAEEATKYEGGKMIPEVAFQIAKEQIEKALIYNKNKTIMILSHDTSWTSYEYIKLLVKYLYDNGFEMRGIDDETVPVHHTIYN